MKLTKYFFLLMPLISSFSLSAQQNIAVSVSNFSFSPKDITINAGDTVTWTNTGGSHNVNGSQTTYPGNPAGFSSGAPATGSWTFKHVFTVPGPYNYQCDPHAEFGMVGTVTVNAPVTGDVVITEIMYNPPEAGTDSLEFIELYNKGTNAVNLLGYRFTSGVEFTFPGFNLGAGQYVIVAVDSVAFERNFGLPAFRFVSGSLSNSGELIRLSDPDGNVVDEVNYDDGGSWPLTPDGLGASLVLCDVNADNNDPANWQGASTPTGVMIDGFQVLANPGGASQCTTGPLIYFVDDNIEIGEDAGTLEVRVALANGGATASTVEVKVGAASTATQGQDFNFPGTTLTFTAGAARDTQVVMVPIIDDMDVETQETIVLRLENPSMGATVDPAREAFHILITDNDASIPRLVISEIMYNPPESGTDIYEFIEIYNNEPFAVDMTGYYFSQGVNDTFPSFTLPAGGFVVVTSDSALFEQTFGVPALQWIDGALTNSGEDIELRDPSGNVVDYVNYDDEAPWDPAADGGGSSLELCDVNADNNDPANWRASSTGTGVLSGNAEIKATPGAANNCMPPMPDTYPPYPIGTVTTVNTDGLPDSLGVTCQLQGVVYGGNLRTSGLQFTIIDSQNDGIGVFSSSADYGYTVTEGDEVIIRGTIGQFSGLLQIQPDTLWFVSAGNTLFSPTVVTALGEETESQLVKLENLTIVNPAQWTNSGSGFNVDVTDGVNTFLMRIDSEVDIFGTSPPTGGFNLTGLGGQFDSSSPFTEGYQILPRYLNDIEQIGSVLDPGLAILVNIYPNPVGDILTIDAQEAFDGLRLTNVIGQPVMQYVLPAGQTRLDLSRLSPGVYTLTFIKAEKVWATQVIRQ